MGRAADRTARRKAEAKEWRRQFDERIAVLKKLGYEVYLWHKWHGEETWCFRKDGKTLDGSSWDSQAAVVCYLEEKLEISNQ